MTSSGRSTGRRHRGRELALRLLFELEGTEKDFEWALTYQAQELGAAPDVIAFARLIVAGCVQHSGTLDTALEDASANWSLTELGKVERAVLRLGAYELLYERETPVAVVIDESIELAKAYAGETAGQFVNGVLGHIARAQV